MTEWLWIAYILTPVAGWGLMDGRPLGLLETAALASVLWLWCSRRPLALAPIVGVALIAKLVLGIPLLAPRGFEALYYANETFSPPIERSIEGALAGTDTRRRTPPIRRRWRARPAGSLLQRGQAIQFFSCDGSGSIAAGVLGGLATLTRSTLVLGWLVALPALVFALKRRRWTTLVLVVAAMLAITSLATMRNWVVARAFVPIASSGPVNLYIGNQPPAPLTTAPEDRVAYERLVLSPYTQMVVDYIRQQPRAFLAGLARKAKFTLGWFDALEPGAGRSTFYIITWAMALVGILLARRSMSPGTGWAATIPMSLALSHFAAVVMIFPNSYGDRLILPFYTLLTPYVGLAVFAAYRRVVGLIAFSRMP